MDAAARLALGAEDNRTVDHVRAWILNLAMGAETFTVCELRRALRNQCIRQAANELPGSDWARAGELAKRVRAFETPRWRQWKRFSAPPMQADAVDRLLWHARRYWPPPKSQGALFRLL